MATGTVIAALLLFLASPAAAAPITVDFETGAAPNEQVKGQYCCPGGVDKGPHFINAVTEAGFNPGSPAGASGLPCDPPYLDANDQAYSSTRIPSTTARRTRTTSRGSPPTSRSSATT